MAQDKIGNKLTVGDTVIFKVPDGEVIANVAELVDVAIESAAGGKMPRRMKLVIDIGLNDLSGRGVYNVLKVYTPASSTKSKISEA
jgi:hypothetical protein